jgi:hypothetical protein
MTRDFVGLLADAVLTAGTDPQENPVLATVLVDTDHAEVLVTSQDDGQGGTLIDTVPSDVVIATSTNGYNLVSQGHCPCEGRLHKPVLITVQDTQSLIKTFTVKGKSTANHRTRVEITGDTVTVSENIQGDRGIAMEIPMMDLDDYPVTVARSLSPDPTRVPVDEHQQPIPPSAGFGLPTAAHEIIAKVAGRRKMPPAIYQYHQRRPVVVEIGSMWHAVFGAVTLDEDNGQQHGPLVRVFPPRLPATLGGDTTARIPV